MSKLAQYVGAVISLEVAGGRYLKGEVIDFGPDIMVIFDSVNRYYYYLPLAHVKYFRLSPREDGGTDYREKLADNATGSLSLCDVLDKAKDILLELFVTGNHPVYGYISDVLSNYVLFNSPVYKTMAINIDHIKWLALTEKHQTFYSKGRPDLNVEHTLTAVAASTFEQQLHKMTGRIVVFDMGTEPNKIGLVIDSSGDFIELISANEETHLLKTNHIKMFHI